MSSWCWPGDTKRGLRSSSRRDKFPVGFILVWGRKRREWPFQFSWVQRIILGDREFRDRLMNFLDQAMYGKKRGSYQGDELREHGEAQAERLLRKGLGALGLSDQDLQGRAKGVKEKQGLAWWLRKKTVVSREWLSMRLEWAMFPGRARL